MAEKIDLNNMEILRADHLYPSGYYYPREEVQSVFGPDSRFMERVKRGTLRGEYGQPLQRLGEPYDSFSKRCMSIDERQVSHLIEDVRLEEDGRVMATIKPVGPKGECLAKLAEHQRPRFAMRAFMQVERQGGKIIPCKGTMSIITYDLVSPEYVISMRSGIRILPDQRFTNTSVLAGTTVLI